MSLEIETRRECLSALRPLKAAGSDGRLGVAGGKEPMMTSSELAERMLNALDELVAADTPLDVILDALIRFAGEASVRAVYRAHPELAT